LRNLSPAGTILEIAITGEVGTSSRARSLEDLRAKHDNIHLEDFYPLNSVKNLKFKGERWEKRLPVFISF